MARAFKNKLQMELIRSKLNSSTKPISLINIAKLVPEDLGPHYRQTRRLIKRLIEEQKIPIVANRQGYFIAKTDEELQKYKNILENSIDGLYYRLQLLNTAFKEYQTN